MKKVLLLFVFLSFIIFSNSVIAGSTDVWAECGGPGYSISPDGTCNSFKNVGSTKYCCCKGPQWYKQSDLTNGVCPPCTPNWGSWVNQGCGVSCGSAGTCSATQQCQKRHDSNGCFLDQYQCVDDPINCPPPPCDESTCSAWYAPCANCGTCGAHVCSSNKKFYMRSCTDPSCITEECRPDSCGVTTTTTCRSCTWRYCAGTNYCSQRSATVCGPCPSNQCSIGKDCCRPGDTRGCSKPCPYKQCDWETHKCIATTKDVSGTQTCKSNYLWGDCVVDCSVLKPQCTSDADCKCFVDMDIEPSYQAGSLGQTLDYTVHVSDPSGCPQITVNLIPSVPTKTGCNFSTSDWSSICSAFTDQASCGKCSNCYWVGCAWKWPEGYKCYNDCEYRGWFSTTFASSKQECESCKGTWIVWNSSINPTRQTVSPGSTVNSLLSVTSPSELVGYYFGQYGWLTSGIIYNYGEYLINVTATNGSDSVDDSTTYDLVSSVGPSCNNNSICEPPLENQLNCQDCQTTVDIIPSVDVMPGQEVNVTITFTDGRYYANHDVKIDLTIDGQTWSDCWINSRKWSELDWTGMSKTGWSCGGGVCYGMHEGHSVKITSTNGYGRIETVCKMPLTVKTGSHTLRAIPTIY